MSKEENDYRFRLCSNKNTRDQKEELEQIILLDRITRIALCRVFTIVVIEYIYI